jgi:hypothetical protein
MPHITAQPIIFIAVDVNSAQYVEQKSSHLVARQFDTSCATP